MQPRGFADAHEDLFTLSAPDDLPEDARHSAKAHTFAQAHTSRHALQTQST